MDFQVFISLDLFLLKIFRIFMLLLHSPLKFNTESRNPQDLIENFHVFGHLQLFLIASFDYLFLVFEFLEQRLYKIVEESL